MHIKHKGFSAEIQLNESAIAEKIRLALPFKAAAHVWKEEIYFEAPVGGVQEAQEKATTRVQQGDVAYWQPGRCICVFFGKTQPISEVMIIGRVVGNLGGFRMVSEGDELRVE